MEVYWRRVHVLYPFLDKAQTEDDYNKVWRGSDSWQDERSFICLLNIIFALASRIVKSGGSAEEDDPATIYYRRAEALLEIVKPGSIRSVQSFLLLGQYFQSTNEPHPCWMFIGIGIRTAQSLGLNSGATSERVCDPRKRELVRKVWHGCILMDRVLAMTYGRPCMVGPKAAAAVPLPLAVDEDDLNRIGAQSRGVHGNRPAVTQFYVETVKLYQHLHDVIFHLYSVNTSTKPAIQAAHGGFLDSRPAKDDCPSIMELERRLFQWEEALPDHLKASGYPREGESNRTFRRQAVVLRQRFVDSPFPPKIDSDRSCKDI